MDNIMAKVIPQEGGLEGTRNGAYNAVIGVFGLFTLIGVKQELEELLQRPVDVVRYREKMNTYLKKQIEREAVYV